MYLVRYEETMKKVLYAMTVMGVLAIGIAIFAKVLSLDNDVKWGTSRITIFGFGLLLNFVSLYFLFFYKKREASKVSYFSQVIILSSLTTFAVFVTYIWIFLPLAEQPSTNFYSQLATAFKNGQLHLPEQPSQALLMLSNPYDYNARVQSNVDFPWDASLYKGKFYIYWGPIPSILLMLLTKEQLTQFGDQYAVIFFTCGLYFYMVLFTATLWVKFNQRLPSWTLVISLLTLGLLTPTPWILSQPRIYEAAIIGCQFFYIGGCYWTYSALNGKTLNPWKLTIAGFHWALALGTRITILPVIAFSTVLTLAFLVRKLLIKNPKRIRIALFALGLPMLFTLLSLSWYNWARFDSIFEFGLRYQLTNTNYSTGSNPFSARYISKNLHNYLTFPLTIRNKFPFILPTENIESNERLAGMLFTSPYILIALIPVGFFISRLAVKEGYNYESIDLNLRNWLFSLFFGSALIALFLNLLFYFAAQRYAEEFMSSALLLATMQVGYSYDSININNKIKKAYLFIVAGSACYSIIANILISLPKSRIREIFLISKEITNYFK